MANCVYTLHTNFTPEMKADELMRKMWDEEVVGIIDQNKPLTADEVLAAWKVAESTCYAEGHYKVAFPWKDDEPPLHCNSTTAKDRLCSLEKHLQRRPDVAKKYCQVMEANKAKGYIRKLEQGEIDDGPSWYLPHFPKKSCSPGSRSDGDVLTSHHGKARQTVPPLPVERARPFETSRSL
ncbi:uncharacterized protein [Montipora foliosa]|uniref:uncharacterized protein n=1 Tax=Montipora foliosa TaxID=591990 RepID=UPI0035F1A5FF